MSRSFRLPLLAGLLSLLSLACPPSPFDEPGDRFPPLDPFLYRTRLMTAKAAQDARGASGVWTCTVGRQEMALAGTDEGLAAYSMPYPGSYMNHLGTLGGPTQAQGTLLRDVETYGHYAYVGSNAKGFREGVMVVDLRDTHPQVTFVRSFLPHDGVPEVGNLSIEPDQGWLLLARAQGVEVWDLAADPQRPAYLATFAPETEVSDLVVRGTKAYLAEGRGRSFSIWDLSDLQAPRRQARWSAGGFAQCIWPSADGTTLVTVQEDPGAPVQVHRWRGEELVPVGSYAEDGKLANGVKVRGDLAYVAFRDRGVVVLQLMNPEHPWVAGRWDGQAGTTTSSTKRLWDVMPVPGRREVLVTDQDKGLFWLLEQF